MFDDEVFDKELDLLKDFTLEEILEQCNVSQEEVLLILLRGGHIDLEELIRNV